MGHDSEVYFWIAISSLPGYQQFCPLDEIFPSLEKRVSFEEWPCECGAGAPARVS